VIFVANSALGTGQAKTGAFPLSKEL